MNWKAAGFAMAVGGAVSLGLTATAAAQAGIAQAQVTGLQAAAAQQAYAQQIGQLSGSVEQTKQTIKQLDKQIDSAAEQTQKSKDTRAEQEELLRGDADDREHVLEVVRGARGALGQGLPRGLQEGAPRLDTFQRAPARAAQPRLRP